VRYYGGRMTLRFLWLDGAWLDRVAAWLNEHGAPSYMLLRRDEVAAFKEHFKGATALARLDAPPIFLYPESGLALYALSAPTTGVTQQLTYDPHALRNVPPVAMPVFGFNHPH
jgi:hypothetical protein